MRRRVFGCTAVLGLVAGTVVVGTPASAATTMYGPYSSKGWCEVARAVAQGAVIGTCFAMPKRGWFFTVER